MENEEIEVVVELDDLSTDIQEDIDINLLAMSVYDDLQKERLEGLHSVGKGIRNIRVIPLCDKYGISYQYSDGMGFFIDTLDGDYRYIYDPTELNEADRYFEELTRLLVLLNYCYTGKTLDGLDFSSEPIGAFIQNYDPFEKVI